MLSFPCFQFQPVNNPYKFKKKIFYFQNDQGGISLGVSNEFDKLGKPIGNFSIETILQKCIDIFRTKIGYHYECSSALKEFGVN